MTSYRDVLGVETDWNGEGFHAEFKYEGIGFAMYERSKLPKLLGREPGYPKGLNDNFESAVNLGPKENVDAFFRVHVPRDESCKIRHDSRSRG